MERNIWSIEAFGTDNICRNDYIHDDDILCEVLSNDDVDEDGDVVYRCRSLVDFSEISAAGDPITIQEGETFIWSAHGIYKPK